jgi:hypothetical protein
LKVVVAEHSFSFSFSNVTKLRKGTAAATMPAC